MDDRLEPQELVERVRDTADRIRRSDAYPAILGAVAGGIAGALMAALIASRFVPPPPPRNSAETASPESSQARLRVDPRDWLQLVAIIAGLVKQARDWYSQEKRKR